MFDLGAAHASAAALRWARRVRPPEDESCGISVVRKPVDLQQNNAHVGERETLQREERES